MTGEERMSSRGSLGHGDDHRGPLRDGAPRGRRRRKKNLDLGLHLDHDVDVDVDVDVDLDLDRFSMDHRDTA